MNDKTKECILNTIIAVGIVSIVIVFPGSILCAVFPDTMGVIVQVAFVIASVSGLLLIILLPIFGGIKSKPVKAEVFASPHPSYEDFSHFLNGSLIENGYHLLKTTSLEPEGAVTVYADTLECSEWNCVSVIRVPELTDELTETANNAITDILTGESGRDVITAYVNMISIFCVDRITPTFRKMVNCNMEQGLKNGRLVAGISFGGKKIYVAKQSGGLFIAKYKKLRKRLHQILNLHAGPER